MVIIYDKKTFAILNNLGTNSAFPEGNLNVNYDKEKEEVLRIHDNSNLAKKILKANYRFKLNNDLTDIEDIETEEEKSEKLKAKKEKQELIEKVNKRNEIQAKMIDILLDVIESNNLKVSEDTEKLLKFF